MIAILSPDYRINSIVRIINFDDYAKRTLSKKENLKRPFSSQFLFALSATVLGIYLPSQGFANDPVIEKARLAAIAEEIRRIVVTAKAQCQHQDNLPNHSNLMRVICENKAINQGLKDNLEQSDLDDFQTLLLRRQNIADQLDRGEITPEQSNQLIFEAQSSLLERLEQK